MILPGTRKVKLADIPVPKGFKERKKAAHIPSRMESIRRHGLINLIVIQDRTRKLLAGGDRLTALLGLKVKTHEVRVFRGTEEEFEALQLAENIERRHNDDVDAMTKRYVELTTGEIEKAVQAEKRARAKEKAAEQPEAPAPSAEPDAQLAPPAETYGLPLLSAEDAYHVVVAQGALKRLETTLGKAEATLARDIGPDTLAAVVCDRILAGLAALAADVRAAYPRAVCPSCKRLPARLAKCQTCSGTGFVGVTAWLNAPDELRLGGDKAVVSDGKGGFVPYSREAAKEEKKAKKLRIEMPDGSALEGGE